MTIFVLELKKIERDNETKNSIFHSNSKAETIVNESDTDNHLILKSNIQTSLGKDSGWIIDSDIKHSINISKDNL